MPDRRTGRYSPAYYAANRERHYGYALRSLYGLTLDEYYAMEEEQGGTCAVCNEPPPRGKRLCVDHDHETGQVRGLLCASCNMTLGRYEANAEWFDRYRERYA